MLGKVVVCATGDPANMRYWGYITSSRRYKNKKVPLQQSSIYRTFQKPILPSPLRLVTLWSSEEFWPSSFCTWPPWWGYRNKMLTSEVPPHYTSSPVSPKFEFPWKIWIFCAILRKIMKIQILAIPAMRCNVEELRMLTSCFGSLTMEVKCRKN